MARFLSEAWFGEVATAGPSAADEPVVTLQQIVTGAPGGDVTYHVTVGGGRAVVVHGPAAHPDATFTQGYRTAAAVARGELTTEAALLAGDIVVAGDLTTLSAERVHLAGLDPLTAAVRAATTF